MTELASQRRGAAEIASVVRRAIQNGRFHPGERLPSERELAKSYEVARGTLREALNKLADEGLVEIRPGSGTYVCATTREDASRIVLNARPLELIDARFALEPHICRLAVLHARLDDFDRAEELLSLMDDSLSDPVAFATADTEFHIVLAEATGNPLLIWIIREVSQVRNLDQWAQMRHLTLNEKVIADYNLQHRNILNAIKTREPERAANQMKEHLETARLSLTRAAAT